MNEIEIGSKLKDVPLRNYDDCEIAVIDNCNLTYEKFFENFILKNLPCVVRNVCWNWECSKNWVKNGNVDYDYFITEYGDLEAPVADCNKVTYNAHSKHIMKVKDYMSYLRQEDKNEILYLKDWHLKRTKPTQKFYEVPRIFASDWLNEFAEDKKDDDFMFVYIGPKESWTPLHYDVYSSYSWSVNVVGRKEWILFPPGEEDKLKDKFGNLPLSYKPEKSTNVKYFEVIQERGDAIFVPSGWHHQVNNVHDTISINHNFINGSNLELVWDNFLNNLLAVEKEIQEFRNTPQFISQSQLILKSVFGMDYISFTGFVIHIGEKRIRQLKGEYLPSFQKYNFGINHIHFDLHIVFKVLNLIQNHPLYNTDYPTPSLKEKITKIITAIEVLLKSF